MESHWSMDEVPSLNGTIIIVTGGNSGIGFECVKEFAAKNAKVIMASRDEKKAKKAIDQIHTLNPKAEIDFIKLDLSNFDSIRAFVRKFQEKYDHLDRLINNAGIMFSPYRITIDGYELHFGTNHLGHFLLTGLLLPLLLKTDGARVVTLSSLAHRSGNLDFDNLQFEKPKSYRAYAAYSRSKLSNILFAYELDRYLKENGSSISSIAAHPGIARTDLFFKAYQRPLLRTIFHHFTPLQTAANGALPVLRAALDPHAKGGEYYGPKSLFGTRGAPVLVASSRKSYDNKLAKKLWDVSMQLTNAPYNVFLPRKGE